MKLKLILCFYLIQLAATAHSKNPSLNDVRRNYMQMKTLKMKALQIVKDSNKLNDELYTCWIEMDRIDQKNYNFIYYDPASTCILKNESTHQQIKYFNRFEDSFQYFDMSNEEILDCYQFTGVNVSQFENPFSDCFYHSFSFQNKAHLTDLGTSYYYNMNNNHNGFAKKIWINHNTLLVDSIHYTAGPTFNKIYFSYDYSNTQQSITSKINFDRKFDSLVMTLKSLNVSKSGPSDNNNVLSAFTPKQLTILDFWYIGCQPCLAGFPKLQNIRDSFSTEFLSILAVNPADAEKNILYFKSKNKYTFNMIKDSLNLNVLYNIQSYPTLLLIDTDGTVIKRAEGSNKEKALLELIEEIKKRQN